MHTNSIRAWIEGQKEFSRREKDILCVFSEFSCSSGLSDRAVMESLGFQDMNAVRPRITELVKAGWLVEVDNIPDHRTGKIVRTCLPSAKLKRLGQPETKTQMEMMI